MLGLDNAGKSSILQGLGSEQQADKKEPHATQGSNVLCLDKEMPPLAIWESECKIYIFNIYLN